MRKRWNRRLAWLLCAAVCLTLLPAAALAAEYPTITVAQALERLKEGDESSVYYLRGTVAAAYSADKGYAELGDPGGGETIPVTPVSFDAVLKGAQTGDEILVRGGIRDGKFAASNPAVIVGQIQDGSQGLDLTSILWDATYACGGGTAQWHYVEDATADDPNVLVLDGAEITAFKTPTGIHVPDNTEIVVRGICTVEGGRGGGGSLPAVYYEGGGALTVEAGASLTVVGANAGLLASGGLRVDNAGTAVFSGASCGILVQGGMTLAGDGVTNCFGSFGYDSFGIKVTSGAVTVEAGARGLAAGTTGGVSTENGGTFTDHSGGGFVTARLDKADKSKGLDVTAVTDATYYPDVGGGTALWQPGDPVFSGLLTLDSVAIDTQKSGRGEGVPGLSVPGGRIVVRGICTVKGGGATDVGLLVGAIQLGTDGALAVEADASLTASAYEGGDGLLTDALRVENHGTAEFSGGSGIRAGGDLTLAGDGVTNCFGYRGSGIHAPGCTVTVEVEARGLAAGTKGGVSALTTLVNHSGGGFVTAKLDSTDKSKGLDVTAVTDATYYSSVGGGTALWQPGDPDAPNLLTLDGVTIIAPEGVSAVSVPADTQITSRGLCNVDGGAGGHGICAQGALALAVEWDAQTGDGFLSAVGGEPGGDGLHAGGGVTLSGPGVAWLDGAHGVYADGSCSVAPEVRGLASGTGAGVTAAGLDNQSKSFLTWEGVLNGKLLVISGEMGKTGLDFTGDSSRGKTVLFPDVGGGSALWVPSASPSADAPHLLILNNAVIEAAGEDDPGVAVPAYTRVEARGDCSAAGPDGGIRDDVTFGAVKGPMAVSVEADAFLAVRGLDVEISTGHRDGLYTKGALSVTVAEGGTLDARGGRGRDMGGAGLNALGGVTLDNGGTARCSGAVPADGVWPDAAEDTSLVGSVGISGSGGVTLSGGGATLCLGWMAGIQAVGGEVTVAPGVRGLAAGFQWDMFSPGGVVNGSAAFLAVDRTALTELPAVDGASHTGGLDLRGVSSAALYTGVGGGAALWEPEASRLTLGGAALTGGIALPSGAVELALQGANTVESAGPALTGADVTVLDRSRAGWSFNTYGPDSLLLSNTLGAAVIGEGTLTAALPMAGRWLTLADGDGNGVSGGAFPGTDADACVDAAPTDGALTLAYGALPAGYYVLTVHGGSGAGIYSLGETAALSCPARDGAGRVFSHWALSDGPGTLSGADGLNASFTMGAGHAAVEAVYRAAPSGGGGGVSSYAITATAGAGGAIDPAGRTSVPAGGTQKFTITPGPGYAISDVLVDGESVGAVASYTFERVDRAHTIEARFAPVNPYSDVAEGDWFYGAALYAYGRGLMTGVSEAEFQPGGLVTRATAAAVLYRLEGAPSSPGGGGVFSDVPAGQWYTDAVAWCSRAGLAGGYGDGRFGPGDPVTREQLAAMLYRYAGYKGWDVSAGENSNILSFADAFDVSEWAVPALQWACGAGLMSGKDGGRLDPRGTATRAELAALLMRLLEKYDPA